MPLGALAGIVSLPPTVKLPVPDEPTVHPAPDGQLDVKLSTVRLVVPLLISKDVWGKVTK